jgi:hypothetical protein
MAGKEKVISALSHTHIEKLNIFSSLKKAYNSVNNY